MNRCIRGHASNGSQSSAPRRWARCSIQRYVPATASRTSSAKPAGDVKKAAFDVRSPSASPLGCIPIPAGGFSVKANQNSNPRRRFDPRQIHIPIPPLPQLLKSDRQHIMVVLQAGPSHRRPGPVLRPPLKAAPGDDVACQETRRVSASRLTSWIRREPSGFIQPVLASCFNVRETVSIVKPR